MEQGERFWESKGGRVNDGKGDRDLDEGRVKGGKRGSV